MTRLAETMRRMMPYVAASLAGFGVAYVAMFVILAPSGAQATPRVPDVVGLTQVDATKQLERAGYAVRPGTPVPHATVAEGTVIEQAPPPGAEEAAGSAVSLVVSAGSRRASVPALIGVAREEAERLLSRIGLTIGTVSERPSSLPRGTVLDTKPVPGASVGLPSFVDVVVSAGAAEVQVPDVLGLGYDAARAALEQLGLVADSAGTDAVPGALARSVVAQAPDAGARVPNGTRIRLTIAAP